MTVRSLVPSEMEVRAAKAELDRIYAIPQEERERWPTEHRELEAEWLIEACVTLAAYREHHGRLPWWPAGTRPARPRPGSRPARDA